MTVASRFLMPRRELLLLIRLLFPLLLGLPCCEFFLAFLALIESLEIRQRQLAMVSIT